MMRPQLLVLALVLVLHTTAAFLLAPNVARIPTKLTSPAARASPRAAAASVTMFEIPTKTSKKAGLEGLKTELLDVISGIRVGLDSPEGSAEREKIMNLVEKIEKQNPTKDPLASGAVDGEWTLRWTTSMRVDLDRPILQRIDTAELKAVNVEPVTTFSWVLGGLKYFNTVNIDLEPVSNTKVDAILSKFSFACFDPVVDGPGLISFPAPVRARGYIDTTYVDSSRTAGSVGTLRISRGNDGNVFILTKNA